MNVRQRAILHALETGSRTAVELANLFIPPAPVPSIRRTIKTLRDRGYQIPFAGGPYSLHTAYLSRPIEPAYDPTFDTDVDPGDEN